MIPHPPAKSTTFLTVQWKVKRDSSTVPIRIAYDCSTRTSSKPTWSKRLPGIHPTHIERPYHHACEIPHPWLAAIIDIEKAFFHIGLDERDRDTTCGLVTSLIRTVRYHRFKSVLSGATCSPFLRSGAILKHLENNKQVSAADVIVWDTYVDNIPTSFKNESDLLFFSHNQEVWCPALVWIFGHEIQAAADGCWTVTQL